MRAVGIRLRFLGERILTHTAREGQNTVSPPVCIWRLPTEFPPPSLARTFHRDLHWVTCPGLINYSPKLKAYRKITCVVSILASQCADLLLMETLVEVNLVLSSTDSLL